MAAANPAATVIDYALQLAAGAAAALAMSFGTSPTAAAASGFYGDQTASAEKICTQVGGQVGPYYQRNGSTVDAYFPGAVTITGNLTVNGTTTTINSTTLDVVDRVVRVNKTTGANDAVPSQITGFNVYRGAVASVARDAYGIFWDESASKWKFAVNTGADDATLGAYLSLQALAITGTTITASTGFVGGTVAGTTASFSGQITSTLANGTAPFVVTSTTLVGNLYVARSALADTVTTNANLTGPITSVGNATSVAAQTGTGSTFVMNTSPTLVTPVLGAATATSLAVGGPLTATWNGTTVTPVVQIFDTTANAALGVARYSAAATAGAVTLAKSRGATIGTAGAVVANDTLGNLQFQGDDGTGSFIDAARILGLATGTVSAGVVPGLLRFMTASSAGTMTTWGQIDSNQVLVAGGAFTSVGTFSAGALRPHIQTVGTAAANAGIAQTFWAANTTGPTGIFAKSRSGTVGTQGVITTGDVLGTLSWQGDDGTNFINAADIVVTCTGTIGTGQVPGIMKFRTASAAGTITQAVAIDSSQVLIVSTTTTSSALYASGTVQPAVQIIGSGANTGAQSIVRFQNNNAGPSLYMGKARSGTIGTMTVVTTGDGLGNIDWQGSDGTNFVSAAKIIVTCTGTIGSAQIPGNMVFQTAGTSGTLATALTIDNAQMATFAGDVTHADAKNIIFNTSTGSKIGTATGQKIGFWNATPVIQPAGATQAAMASYVTGAFGLDSNAHMQALYDLVAAMRTALVNTGIMKGAA